MKKIRSINGLPSIILDCLRLLAALTVLYYHLQERYLPTLTGSDIIARYGHAAVVVFFVLSGYVISYTTSVKNRGLLKYMVARFSRLYSIVFPSLIIILICELIIKFHSPILYNSIVRGPVWPRYLLSMTFLNETWFFSAAPPIDKPLWSLGYEFAFYIIFGLWFYRKKGFKYLLLPIICCLIIWPKVMLMFPIWLSGYYAYKLPIPNVKRIVLFILAIFGFALAVLGVLYLPLIPNELPKAFNSIHLYVAAHFITDFLVGLCIAFSLWVLPAGEKQLKQTNLVKLFRTAADLTFPLYVLHMPMLALFDSLFRYKIQNISQLFSFSIIILSLTGFIGFLLEKQRFLWNSLFENLFNYIKTKFS